MATNSFKQNAGDNSTQVSAGIIINNGLSREEVCNILQGGAKKILAEANESARQIASDRIEAFSSVLVDKLVSSGHLEAFRDPATHVTLRMAQEAAICTDEKTDYEILAELLVYRSEHPNDKMTNALVKKAISEMDNISEDALNALTIAFSITAFTPVSGLTEEGVEVIDSLFAKLLGRIKLPVDMAWIDNLEIVGAIRINSLGRLKEYEEIVQNNFSGYCVLRIKKDTGPYKKALEILASNNIPPNILVDNPLLEGYVRIAVSSLGRLEEIVLVNKATGLRNPLTDEQKDALRDVAKLYVDSGNDFDTMKKKYKSLLLSHAHIAMIAKWWNSISETDTSFTITSVGQILANTNARRMDPELPDLNNGTKV